jgi:hypothetical protein
MKKSILYPCLALACAFGLAACSGSDDGQLQLVVGLGGVTKAGLTVSNKGGTPLAVAPGAAFSFPDLIPIDSDYDIKVVTQPPNTIPGSCVVNNGKGNTGPYSPQNISIVCVVTTYTLGGTVSGLTGGDLEVNNGAQSIKILKNATTFNMSTPTTAFPKMGEVPEDKPYGLTILKQPASGTCVIANPNGIMPAGPVNNIVITCTTP